MRFSLLAGRYEDPDLDAEMLPSDGEKRLADRGTTYVAVANGLVVITGVATLRPGMFAALPGGWLVQLTGARALAVHVKHYTSMLLAGGPIEPIGRLRYIDGCSDTGLLGPLKRGDPCLNHLHFPPGITQTLHTHPSVRIGMIMRGIGQCIGPVESPLRTGDVFVIPTGAVHGFATSKDKMMDIIAFHPDSIVGPTDEHHQMLDATIPA
jgi:quercetin dioxygenase-like cupin family protein